MPSFAPQVPKPQTRANRRQGARLHHGSGAEAIAHGHNARAVTVGNDIYFGQGQFKPGTPDGEALIAHEMTHVGQQSNMAAPMIQKSAATENLQAPRFAGDFILELVFDNQLALRVGVDGPSDGVRKVQQALMDLGIPLKHGADGHYGEETKAAVIQFQRDAGMNAANQDGVVGFRTMSFLDSRFVEGSAVVPESRCQDGIRTVKVDVLPFFGFTDSMTTHFADANRIMAPCCLQFEMVAHTPLSETETRAICGGCLTYGPGDCDTALSPHELRLVATPQFQAMSHTMRVLAVARIQGDGSAPAQVVDPSQCPEFRPDTDEGNAGRLQGHAKSDLCATRGNSPLSGMFQIAQGASSKTLAHEFGHYLQNTFADHTVATDDNLMSVSDLQGTNIAPQQCDIMYTRALEESLE